MPGISFSFAFGAGVLAAFNPCAFAMLPSFLVYFLGADDADFAEMSWARRAWAGVRVGGIMVTGFVLIFMAAGILFAAVGSQIARVIPWIALVIGLLLIALGVLILLGKSFHVRIPNPVERVEGVGVRAIFLYGLSYGVASLSCTLPIFLMIVGGSLAAGGSMSGALIPFIGYSLGMAAVVITLTLSTALLKGTLVGHARRVLPYVNALSGVLLIVAGAYIVYFQARFSIFISL